MMISESQQKYYREKYNPDGSRLRCLQLGMLEILKYIDKVCSENNISYWLSSGTCLGAVRHGGFIPWDDDVDIEMLRPDYEKLLRVLSHTEGDYCLQTNSNDPYFIYDFGKLRNPKIAVDESLPLAKYYTHKGVFVDIFKLEESNSEKLHYICGRLRTLEFHILNWSASRCKFLVKPAMMLHKWNDVLFSLIRLLDRIGNKDRLRHTLGVTFTEARSYKDIFPLRRVRLENVDLPIPNSYDNYLSKMYGDYNKIVIGPSHLIVSDNCD